MPEQPVFEIGWMSREYIYDIDIKLTVVVTYSTGVVLLLASKGIEGMFELDDAQYIALIAGFVVLYLLANLSLIPINLSSPLNPDSE